MSKLNDLCLSCLDQLHQGLLDYIEQIPNDERNTWNSIAALLDDQIVRFELWNAEIEVEGREETFPDLDEHPEHDSAASYDASKVLQLVEDALRQIYGLVVDLSGLVVELIPELDTTRATQEYVVPCKSRCIYMSPIFPSLFHTNGHIKIFFTTVEIESTISRVDQLIGNLFDLARPVQALQAIRYQKGPYHDRRQRILAVKSAATKVSISRTETSSHLSPSKKTKELEPQSEPEIGTSAPSDGGGRGILSGRDIVPLLSIKFMFKSR